MSGNVIPATIVPDRVVMKVGALEVRMESGMPNRCEVLLDGRPFPVQRLTVELDAEALPKVTAEFVPMPRVVGKEKTAESNAPAIEPITLHAWTIPLGQPGGLLAEVARIEAEAGMSDAKFDHLEMLSKVLASRWGEQLSVWWNDPSPDKTAEACLEGHHLKDGPCANDYCRCACKRCRQQCEEVRP